ncbi:MAG: 4Fe-4S binding protein [Ferrimicrobium sp.]
MTELVIKGGEATPEELKPSVTVRYEQGSSSLTVRRAYCKGCKLCIEACPSSILELNANDTIYVTDIDKCVFCGACAGRCPDFVFVLRHGALVGQEEHY